MQIVALVSLVLAAVLALAFGMRYLLTNAPRTGVGAGGNGGYPRPITGHLYPWPVSPGLR